MSFLDIGLLVTIGGYIAYKIIDRVCESYEKTLDKKPLRESKKDSK